MEIQGNRLREKSIKSLNDDLVSSIAPRLYLKQNSAGEMELMLKTISSISYIT
jgi:hypothetical protein